MIRFLILLFLALVLGAAVALYLRADSGYVLVSYGKWVLETSLLGFLAATVLLLMAAVYGIRFLVTLARLPALFRGALGARRDRLARQSFDTGLRKLLEGRWKQAEIDLVRRAADHHAGTLNYLLAARAAQRAGHADRREHYLELAARGDDDSALLAALVRAELLLEHGEPTSALKILEELYRRNAKHPRAIELLAEAQARAGDWESLRRLLADVSGRGALEPARYAALMEQALCNLLAAAGTAARMDSLKSAWDSAPAEYQRRPAVRRAYVAALIRVGAESEAAAQVTKALKQGWDAELVSVYGQLDGIDQMSQLANVEHWLAQYGEEPELLRTAGRVCIKNRLWGKARSYLDGAVQREPSAEGYRLLAQLCEETKNAEEAQKFYKMGLELAAK